MSSSANSDDEAELVDPAEIARGAVASKIEKKATSTPESDSESDSEMEMGFVPASQVKPDKISKAVRWFPQNYYRKSSYGYSYRKRKENGKHLQH